MGNTSSTNQKQFIDIIETKIIKIIKNTSWQDMQNMEKTQHCDKILALTTKIFQKNLSSHQIDYLAHRIKHGETPMIIKNQVTWIQKNNLEKLNNSKDKKRICQGIAKFYIKIANVFFAVIKTINPQYVLNDINGQQQKIPLLEYGKLPKDAEKKLKLFGFCQKRINALKYETNEDKTITVFPSPCKLIQEKYRDEHGKCVTKYKKFSAEPGVPELKNLYKDIYNYDPRSGQRGKYTKLSKDAMKQYRYDLKQFYKTFTGKQLPDNIKSFSEIKLSDYSCKFDPRIKCPPREKNSYANPEGYQPITLDSRPTQNTQTMNTPINTPMNTPINIPMNTPINTPMNIPPNMALPTGQVGGALDMRIRHKSHTGSLNNEYFSKYANHLARMIGYAQQNQQKLIQLLERIFVSSNDNIIINPKLNNDELQKITDETRNTIVKLYIKCEEDFRKGLELFDDIIKEKELQKINRQEKMLKKQLNTVLNS